MPSVREIILQHDQYITSKVSDYKSRLEVIVAEATARTISELHRKLTIDAEGNIANTAGNQRVLRSIDSIFAAKMEAAGFPALSQAYANGFAGQLPFIDDILDTLSAQLKRALPDVRDVIQAEDRRILASQQLSVVDSLQSVVDQIGASAKRQALFGIAGMPIGDLSVLLSNAFHKTLAQAETIADTAATVFFRTISDRAYQVIENDLPQMVIRYEYEGPLDQITRVFCRRLLAAHKTYTRDEIDQMDNGSLPNVFLTCGSWNCRHQWIISLN